MQDHSEDLNHKLPPNNIWASIRQYRKMIDLPKNLTRSLSIAQSQTSLYTNISASTNQKSIEEQFTQPNIKIEGFCSENYTKKSTISSSAKTLPLGFDNDIILNTNHLEPHFGHFQSHNSQKDQIVPLISQIYPANNKKPKPMLDDDHHQDEGINTMYNTTFNTNREYITEADAYLTHDEMMKHSCNNDNNELILKNMQNFSTAKKPNEVVCYAIIPIHEASQRFLNPLNNEHEINDSNLSDNDSEDNEYSEKHNQNVTISLASNECHYEGNTNNNNAHIEHLDETNGSSDNNRLKKWHINSKGNDIKDDCIDSSAFQVSSKIRKSFKEEEEVEEEGLRITIENERLITLLNEKDELIKTLTEDKTRLENELKDSKNLIIKIRKQNSKRLKEIQEDCQLKLDELTKAHFNELTQFKNKFELELQKKEEEYEMLSQMLNHQTNHQDDDNEDHDHRYQNYHNNTFQANSYSIDNHNVQEKSTTSYQTNQLNDPLIESMKIQYENEIARLHKDYQGMIDQHIEEKVKLENLLEKQDQEIQLLLEKIESQANNNSIHNAIIKTSRFIDENDYNTRNDAIFPNQIHKVNSIATTPTVITNSNANHENEKPNTPVLQDVTNLCQFATNTTSLNIITNFTPTMANNNTNNNSSMNLHNVNLFSNNNMVNRNGYASGKISYAKEENQLLEKNNKLLSENIIPGNDTLGASNTHKKQIFSIPCMEHNKFIKYKFNNQQNINTHSDAHSQTNINMNTNSYASTSNTINSNDNRNGNNVGNDNNPGDCNRISNGYPTNSAGNGNNSAGNGNNSTGNGNSHGNGNYNSNISNANGKTNNMPKAYRKISLNIAKNRIDSGNGLDTDYYKCILEECEKNRILKFEQNQLHEIEANISMDDENPLMNQSIRDLPSKIKLKSNLSIYSKNNL